MKKIIILGIGLLMLVISVVLWFLNGAPPSPNVPSYSEFPSIQSTSTVETVLLTDLVDTTPDASFQAVIDLLYLDIYKTYQCPELGADEQALLVTAKYTPDANGLNTLDEASLAVVAWESRMLTDVGHLLFPSITLNERNVPLTFSPVPGTTMRSAETVVSGTQVTVAYSWLLNYVLISTSLDCLEMTMGVVYEHDI
jgi:hypothetical protein